MQNVYIILLHDIEHFISATCIFRWEVCLYFLGGLTLCTVQFFSESLRGSERSQTCCCAPRLDSHQQLSSETLEQVCIMLSVQVLGSEMNELFYKNNIRY